MKRILFLVLFVMLSSISPLAQEDATIEFGGVVQSFDGTTAVINGLSVDLSAIDVSITSQLAVNMNVNVSGNLSNGVVTATIIILPQVNTNVSVVTVNHYNVSYNGSTYDGSSTTFSYTVMGTGSPPALSHFDIEIPMCDTLLQVTAYSPETAVEFGTDPTTGIDGIKWDFGIGESATQTYTITFEGFVAEGEVQVAVKAGNGAYYGIVIGPACTESLIDVEKLVSSDGVTWTDADSAPGLDIELDGQVWFQFMVSNVGTADLLGVTLTDDKLDLSSCIIPDTLLIGESFECVLGPFPVEAGQHTNTATVEAVLGDGTGLTVDTDNANYFGGDRPEIDVEGYVSNNGGSTWSDADNAPGLLVEVDSPIEFQFILTNTGNVALENFAVADSTFDLSGCSIPTMLELNTSFTCTSGEIMALEGQQSTTTTVSAMSVGDGVIATDSDMTYYIGGTIDDVLDDDDNLEDDAIIVIEGPVDSIDGNEIEIYGIKILLDEDDPLLLTIQIGDWIRIEGIDEGAVIIVVNIIFVDVDVFIFDGDSDGNGAGEVWRDTGDCSNGPPPWAPAHGWRRKCESGNGNSSANSNGNGKNKNKNKKKK